MGASDFPKGLMELMGAFVAEAERHGYEYFVCLVDGSRLEGEHPMHVNYDVKMLGATTVAAELLANCRDDIDPEELVPLVELFRQGFEEWEGKETE